MSEIKNLIKLSKYAGMREDIVQAGGGNTSVKIDDKTMFIKSLDINFQKWKKIWGILK